MKFINYIVIPLLAVGIIAVILIAISPVTFYPHTSWRGYVFPDTHPSYPRVWTYSDIVAQADFDNLNDCAKWGASHESYYYECDALLYGRHAGFFEFRPEPKQ